MVPVRATYSREATNQPRENLSLNIYLCCPFLSGQRLCSRWKWNSSIQRTKLISNIFRNVSSMRFFVQLVGILFTRASNVLQGRFYSNFQLFDIMVGGSFKFVGSMVSRVTNSFNSCGGTRRAKYHHSTLTSVGLRQRSG